MKNVDMPVLANLDTPRRVHLKKRPAAPPQGLFFAAQKNYFDGVEKNPRSAPAACFLYFKSFVVCLRFTVCVRFKLQSLKVRAITDL